MPKDRGQLTYTERSERTKSGVGKKLLELMTRKQTNLCVSLDVTDVTEFLRLVDLLGPELAILKTHIDTLQEFDKKIPVELESLAREHDFLIFEDRKFADLGQTVQVQYAGGFFRIIEWADMVNAHPIVGPGIVDGLKAEIEKHDLLKQRAVILLAQMTSKGNLIDADYTKQTVALAKRNEEFVMGFIGAGDVGALAKLAGPEFIILTPGVQLAAKSGDLGQQYVTPADVISAGADVIIVGRGIWQADDPLAAAREYRKAGWEAYQARITAPKVEQAKKKSAKPKR